MNYFKFRFASCQKLKMDGSLAESERFIVSEALPINEGDRITFGPVRLGSPVMGYFYDEEDQPLMLINHTNIEITHTFKEGMVMVSILAPKAAAIRLQLTIAEKDLFYIYINEEICLEELPNERWLSNPLKGRNLLTIGDSLCAASKDPMVDGLRGWARRIRDQYEANVFNAGIGGTALSDCRMSREKATEYHQIFKQINRFKGFEYDYILLEGGGNDSWDKAPIGSISDSFDPKDFDLTTYAGGLEMAIYTAVKEYGDTAAIGYMSIYPMPLEPNGRFTDMGDYFPIGKQICEKWGIPYLDLFTLMSDFDTEKYTWNGKSEKEGSGPDYIHANVEGYDMMQEYIGPFVSQMKPISQDIYLEVQKYGDIPVLGPTE